MKKIKIFYLCLLIFTARSIAYEAPAYYVNGNKFSLDGYDFIAQDRSFPIIKGKYYDIVEEGEEILIGSSFRKLMRITDLDTGESQLFKTRVINSTKQAIIMEAKELERKVTHEFEPSYGEGLDWWYYYLNIRYEITLEDGEKLDFHYRSKSWRKPVNMDAITLIAGDQIEFLRQKEPRG